MNRVFGARYLCRNLREEENQLLTYQLQERVRLLRTLSIEIGAEARYQNRYLGRFDDDLDKTDSVLKKAMNKVSQLTSSPQHYYIVFVFLFACVCLVFVWCVLRFRLGQHSDSSSE